MGHNDRIKYGDDVDEHLFSKHINKKVCSEHINDSYIEKYIKENGKPGRCSYCNKKEPVIEFNELLDLLQVGIDFKYEDPANSRYYSKEGEHGYDGDTFNAEQLWYCDKLNISIVNSILNVDLINATNTLSVLCEIDEFSSDSEYKMELWGYFKEIVMHKARFVFHFDKKFDNFFYRNPATILEDIQEYLLHFKCFENLPEGTKLYRCRSHEESGEIANASVIASPPKNVYSNGRMNPAGVSMFYCSESEDLTIKEVVNFKDKKNKYYTTAVFATTKKYRLLDLTNLPDFPSIFDCENNKFIQPLRFLNAFIKDATEPIVEKDSIVEYVPTQIVTEYIKYNPKFGVQGIRYPSAKDRVKSNIVLFLDHEESLDQLNFDPSSIKEHTI